ncbi:hypothetical protein K490DRAFT_60920 [Saccharata proteae CBS 121410]|uniref:FAR-17a/AIG1-like protein n=1 Tax=Saccharata proteae CBS 121410 TaxID=1314787 RepID=A0A9P4LZU2_9PEZI|nr:hypothetical protein K490DRAFT_60920 [Saccharata proteae CBS 121410]
MLRFWPLFGVETPFDPYHRFETSTILSPLALGCVRSVLAFYGILTIILSLTLPVQQPAGASFSYFSNITWWGITWYQVFASIHTLSYARTGRSLLERWPRFFQLAHSLLYTTIMVFPLMVTIVFWALQFKPSKFADPVDAWSNTTHHALNSAYALFEIIVPRTERPLWIHLPCIVILLGGYAGIAYITHATEGFYTYAFLNPHKHKTGTFAGIIIGMGAICIVLFVIVYLLIWLRLWLTETVLGKPGKFADRDTARLNSVLTVESDQDSKEKQDRMEQIV